MSVDMDCTSEVEFPPLSNTLSPSEELMYKHCKRLTYLTEKIGQVQRTLDFIYSMHAIGNFTSEPGEFEEESKNRECRKQNIFT